MVYCTPVLNECFILYLLSLLPITAYILCVFLLLLFFYLYFVLPVLAVNLYLVVIDGTPLKTRAHLKGLSLPIKSDYACCKAQANACLGQVTK